VFLHVEICEQVDARNRSRFAILVVIGKDLFELPD
jgi:hypothetical protein